MRPPPHGAPTSLMTASDLEELYRDILLDHYRSPRNKGHIPGEASCAEDGSNPLCGDQIRIELNVEDGHIEAIAFDGNGCSISQASASMMTEYVKGRSIEDALDGVQAVVISSEVVEGKARPLYIYADRREDVGSSA